jgi:hypothetical protein
MMLHGDTVHDTRKMFFSSWHKYRHHQALLPLEKQIVDVILIHPEYHALLESSESALDRAYLPELGQTNPFLHMGLHLTIRDQLSTNRPSGIIGIYQQLLQQYKNPEDVEHLMMEPLVDCLYKAQKQACLPDEASYLKACRQLIGLD